MDIELMNHNLSKASLEKAKDKIIDPAEDKALKEACAGFEAILMQTMLKSMRQSLPGDALFKESNATNIYKSMQDQYLAETLSKGPSSIGLKDFLYEHLKDSL